MFSRVVRRFDHVVCWSIFIPLYDIFHVSTCINVICSAADSNYSWGICVPGYYFTFIIMVIIFVMSAHIRILHANRDLYYGLLFAQCRRAYCCYAYWPCAECCCTFCRFVIGAMHFSLCVWSLCMRMRGVLLWSTSLYSVHFVCLLIVSILHCVLASSRPICVLFRWVLTPSVLLYVLVRKKLLLCSLFPFLIAVY